MWVNTLASVCFRRLTRDSLSANDARWLIDAFNLNALIPGHERRVPCSQRQVPVRFSVVSSQAPIPFQKARNEYEIEPQGTWSPRPDSNRGPFPYQGNALPPELRGRGAASRFYRLAAALPAAGRPASHV